MNKSKTFKTIAFLLILLLTGYFYFLEFRKNWDVLQNFKLNFNACFLTISLLIIMIAYLLETIAWRIGVNKHPGRQELNFSQSVAIVNTSGLLKYPPGRVWTYTAQLIWLKKYGISKSIILRTNLICILGSGMVSLYLGVSYLALYTNSMTSALIAFAAAILILFNVAYVAWNPAVMNKVFTIAGRLLKKEFEPLSCSKAVAVSIQFIYLCSAALTGIAVYFLGRGIGLNILLADTYPILASMSVAWFAGYLAVIAPGGLGVREGVMLLMLDQVVNAQTALIFPVLSRVMFMIAEALLGLGALLLGVKYGIFSARRITLR